MFRQRLAFRFILGAAGIGDALSALRMEDVAGTETQGRLSRARVPLWFDVLKQGEVQKDGVQAKLLSYPDSHGLSLQSRADNKVFLKVLSGEFRLERARTRVWTTVCAGGAGARGDGGVSSGWRPCPSE